MRLAFFKSYRKPLEEYGWTAIVGKTERLMRRAGIELTSYYASSLLKEIILISLLQPEIYTFTIILKSHFVAGEQKNIAFRKMFIYANSQYFRTTAVNFAPPYN
jgi:hypothetical protein